MWKHSCVGRYRHRPYQRQTSGSCERARTRRNQAAAQSGRRQASNNPPGLRTRNHFAQLARLPACISTSCAKYSGGFSFSWAEPHIGHLPAAWSTETLARSHTLCPVGRRRSSTLLLHCGDSRAANLSGESAISIFGHTMRYRSATTGLVLEALVYVSSSLSCLRLPVSAASSCRLLPATITTSCPARSKSLLHYLPGTNLRLFALRLTVVSTNYRSRHRHCTFIISPILYN